MEEVAAKFELARLVGDWLRAAMQLHDYWRDVLLSDDFDRPKLSVSFEEFHSSTTDAVKQCYLAFPEVDTTPLIIFFQKASSCLDASYCNNAKEEILRVRRKYAGTPSDGMLSDFLSHDDFSLHSKFEAASGVILRILLLLDVTRVQLYSYTVVSVIRQTNTVRIAGHKDEYKIKPHLTLILGRIVENKKAGIPFTKSDELRELPGCKGKNFTREIANLVAAIPPLREILLSDNQGYWLDK